MDVLVLRPRPPPLNAEPILRTKAVVANLVLLSETAGVGAVGAPVSAGLASGA